MQTNSSVNDEKKGRRRRKKEKRQTDSQTERKDQIRI